MSFASAEDVMKITERLIQVLWQTFFQEVPFQDKIKHPQEYLRRDIPYYAPLYFPRLTYHGAMKIWGSDKPDTRLGSAIHQVQDFLDAALKSKISSLKDPIIDFMRIRVHSSPRKTKDFISSFLLSPSAAEYIENPHGAPGIFIFDPSKPMSGLSAFEHEAGEKITEMVHPQRGDLLVLQARPNKPFAGESSTMIGNLRRDLHMALVSEGLTLQPKRHEFLWVEDFPLFSPTNDTEPGQGGKAGIKSTHHPFTAPKKWGDVEKMTTDPLSCTAAHFDLVIDGVEVGGGSRRIHDSKIQEMVLKDILKVPERQIEEFRPLLEALRAGCPPHAGIALGFDRLMAILRNASTVRDVIAFPKSANGKDKMSKAPSAVDAHRWAEYHMVPEGGETLGPEKEKKDESSPASVDVDIERELRSVASSEPETPGAAQPGQDGVTPSTPS
jgi:aspartyl-tRNA synthetase